LSTPPRTRDHPMSRTSVTYGQPVSRSHKAQARELVTFAITKGECNEHARDDGMPSGYPQLVFYAIPPHSRRLPRCSARARFPSPKCQVSVTITRWTRYSTLIYAQWHEPVFAIAASALLRAVPSLPFALKPRQHRLCLLLRGVWPEVQREHAISYHAVEFIVS